MVAPEFQKDPWGQARRCPRTPPAINLRATRAHASRLLLPAQLEDLDGTALYAALGVDPRAPAAEVKAAYRAAALRLHPDRGGAAPAFAAARHAYEVLSDPRRRAVYDTWARELAFRHVRAAGAPAAQGGEGALLDEFSARGLAVDPACQLVVTCEVCRRPATKRCWTCAMDICEFCTLKRHWRDGSPLHWPLVDAAHMSERLARRELERKRVEDAARGALEDPHHRSDAELRDVRAFRDAAAAALADPGRRRRYDPALSKFYMWAQTADTVFVACRVPTGYSDRELVIEAAPRGLLVQAEGSPPLLDRELWGALDPSRAVETLRTEDNRVAAVALPKAERGAAWRAAFAGDSDGARALEPPYSLLEGEEEVALLAELPFWVEARDVRVAVGEDSLEVEARGELSLRRTYWRGDGGGRAGPPPPAVVPGESTWTLDDDVDAAGGRCRVLTVRLARPEPTDEEVAYKRGRRQDNTQAARPGSLTLKGFRFFADDEDAHGLEAVLQALCFAAAGEAHVPPPPWEAGAEPRRARAAGELPPEARALLERLAAAGGAIGVVDAA
jgi:hypothetical protein